MSEKEIKNLKREYKFGTKNYWKISLREMINSVWCYDNYSDINKYLENKYILGYQEYGLTLEEIKEITINQVDYLNKNCKIIKNVYIDSEGLPYNSIVEV